MSLTSGTQLGSYEVLSLLGRGGMGEVYRARDLKLKREVAIKTLPDEFSRDPERLARFQREAEALAALNHPNIGSIYHLQESNGSRYLVLELVEGDTLAGLLAKRGALPVDEALNIAKQICEALEAAHEKGITHRDLKPANIKVTPNRKVKLLDFGLARVLSEPPKVDLSNSPTMANESVPGVILGTAAYMSPEQARGELADKRSDIWAFGCVLYEMLTGRLVFQGKSATELLGAVMYKEVDWTVLPASTPLNLQHVLRRCLQRDRTLRLRDIGDVRIELNESVDREQNPAINGLPRRSAVFAWVIAAIAILLVIAMAVPTSRYLRNSAEERQIRFEVAAPESNPLPGSAYVSALNLAMSPDGTKLVYEGTGPDRKRMLFVRPIDSVSARALPGTEGASEPFWSPDSRYIGYWDRPDNRLLKIDTNGGAPQVLCTMPGSGGSWSGDGIIIFSSTSGIYRVSAAGGTPSSVITLGKTPHELAYYWPYFLSDGQHFVYLSWSSDPGQRAIYAGSLDGKVRQEIIRSESMPAFTPPGYLLFHKNGTLFAQPFDESRLMLSGEPVRLVEGVGYSSVNGRTAFSLSFNGTLAYRSGSRSAYQLVWLDRSGKSAGRPFEPDVNSPIAPAISPDGKRVALDRNVNGNRDIWIMDLEHGGMSRFTFDPAVDGLPVWSADGSHIFFESTRPDPSRFRIFIKSSTGTGQDEPLLESSGSQWPIDVSRDGKFLLYHVVANKGDLWALPLTGADRKPIAVATTPFAERVAVFSPDGRLVAYETDESGRLEIVVQPFPTPNGKWQVSTNGGNQPRWRNDGKELYFIAPDNKMMAATIATSGSSFSAGTPVALFPVEINRVPAKQEYDVSRDGRFLVDSLVETGIEPITVVVNWLPKAH